MSNVVIIGGGLGGLCLAQGLKQAGIPFTVFERDPDAGARVQGYRLSLTPDGFAALHANLPPALWAKVEAATAPIRDGMSLATEQLEELMFLKPPPPKDTVRRFGSISRVTLREILLEGLGDAVRFGQRFERYEPSGDGVVAHFEGGTRAEGRLLVGADGVNSRVQPQFLPAAARVDTGVCAISGKIPLAGAQLAEPLPEPLGDSAVIIDRLPQGMFLARHQLDAGQGSYVFFSFGGARERFPADLDSRPPTELLGLLDQMTTGWSPRLMSLLHRADPSTVKVLRFKSSPRVSRWNPGRVSLLGDAIHSMPPSGGLGANTALRDASVLARELSTSNQDWIGAVGRYESAMFRYAFPAIDESMNNLRRMARPNLTLRRLGRFGAKMAGRLLGMTRPPSRTT